MKTDNVTAKQILTDARRARLGVAAFNFTDIWDLTAIVNAAERMNVPMMASSFSGVAEALGLDMCQAMVDTFRRRSSVPIIHHLDHSHSVEMCIDALDVGYPSVMIDGSKHPLQQSIRMTREVVEYAHRKGAIVEGEIGQIMGRGVEGDFEGDSFLAKVDEAVELVSKTKVDSLAVGIGTAHGFYTEKPKIYFDRLEALAVAVDVPLVLHGGTGIPDEDIRKAIRLGITKVNVGTVIHTTYLRQLREELIRAGDFPFTVDVMRNVLPKIEEVLDDRLRVITGNGEHNL
jgi:ketose-bisphosphate aldolase